MRAGVRLRLVASRYQPASALAQWPSGVPASVSHQPPKPAAGPALLAQQQEPGRMSPKLARA